MKLLVETILKGIKKEETILMVLMMDYLDLVVI